MAKKKYSFDLKLKVVKTYLESTWSAQKVANYYNVNESDVRKWRDLFLVHGEDGLHSKQETYTGEFKTYVVEYMERNGLTIRETAALFNIKTHTTVSRWKSIYETKGKDSLYSLRRGGVHEVKLKSSDIVKNLKDKEDLVAEIQRLRMENEYLKKLHALVQKRIALENGNEPPSSTN